MSAFARCHVCLPLETGAPWAQELWAISHSAVPGAQGARHTVGSGLPSVGLGHPGKGFPLLLGELGEGSQVRLEEVPLRGPWRILASLLTLAG